MVLSRKLFFVVLCFACSKETPKLDNEDFKPDVCLHEAFVESVYDGDTFTASVFLDFKLRIDDEKFRLFGIDAPELRGIERSKGIASRDYLSLLIERKMVSLSVDSHRTDKYGRYLVIVYTQTDTGRVNVNETMVKQGHATIMTER